MPCPGLSPIWGAQPGQEETVSLVKTKPSPPWQPETGPRRRKNCVFLPSRRLHTLHVLGPLAFYPRWSLCLNALPPFVYLASFNSSSKIQLNITSSKC